jgi:hypothetical protein
MKPSGTPVVIVFSFLSELGHLVTSFVTRKFCQIIRTMHKNMLILARTSTILITESISKSDLDTINYEYLVLSSQKKT